MVGPDGVAYVSTPNVLTLAPQGEERSGNPWHVREYRPEEFAALCARHFARVDTLGLFHARKLRLHQLAIERAGWDAVHKRLRRDQAVLRPLRARHLGAGLPAAARRSAPRAGPARRAAAMSRAPGALAIVLHTHMPYVEGFGTWPFGEEWLWEAVATSYVPLLDVLDARPGRVTLSVTPVLADQLAAPGALRALRGVPARDPAGVARARPRARGERGRAGRAGVQRRALRAAVGPSPAWGSGSPRTRRGRRAPRTPCSRCSRRTPACGCRWRRGSRRSARGRAAGAAGSGCPSARTRRGSTRCWPRPARASRAST